MSKSAPENHSSIERQRQLPYVASCGGGVPQGVPSLPVHKPSRPGQLHTAHQRCHNAA